MSTSERETKQGYLTTYDYILRIACNHMWLSDSAREQIREQERLQRLQKIEAEELRKKEIQKNSDTMSELLIEIKMLRNEISKPLKK